MTTLAALADQAQIDIADSGASTWPQATVESWAIEAIRDYSKHFQRTLTDSITTTANKHDYDLPEDFLAILSVEYPAGEDPPEFLKPMSRRDPRFWANDCYYDIETTGEVSVATIWISADPPAGETIAIYYTAPHKSDLLPADSISVPDQDIPLLIALIVWKALSEELAAEMQNPDTTIHLIRDMREATAEARNAYQAMLKQAKDLSAESGFTRPWKVDDFDRIY